MRCVNCMAENEVNSDTDLIRLAQPTAVSDRIISYYFDGSEVTVKMIDLSLPYG